MTKLYPLKFKPLFRQYLWGGRRLADVLHKSLGAGNDYAESWEVVDHGEDQSVIANGIFAGAPLRQVISEHGDQLYGDTTPFRQFPLLFKLLDCQRNLSVQVHPNDQQAKRLTPPDLGKTEAWVILDALPNSKVYAGIKRGFDRPAFEREVARGTTELCLHSIEPQVGDCIFIPAGTVHALGAGLLVAEIQQSSDTTFRLFDWNRSGADGKPRELHIEQALGTIDFERGPVAARRSEPTSREPVERLVACDKFVLDRWTIENEEALTNDHRFHILYVVEGEIAVSGDPSEQPLAVGQTMLIPAACSPHVTLRPTRPTVLLDMYLPITSLSK